MTPYICRIVCEVRVFIILIAESVSGVVTVRVQAGAIGGRQY